MSIRFTSGEPFPVVSVRVSMLYVLRGRFTSISDVNTSVPVVAAVMVASVAECSFTNFRDWPISENMAVIVYPLAFTLLGLISDAVASVS
jgi:hypothetical protein